MPNFSASLCFQILINRPLEGSKQDLESQSLIEVGQAAAGGLVVKSLRWDSPSFTLCYVRLLLSTMLEANDSRAGTTLAKHFLFM